MLNPAPSHEGVWGSRGIFPGILNLGIDVRDLSVYSYSRFSSTERALGVHWVEV